jgi:hypothetical protein
MDNSGDLLATLFMATTVVGIFPSIVSAMRDAVEGIMQLVNQAKEYKEKLEAQAKELKEKLEAQNEKLEAQAQGYKEQAQGYSAQGYKEKLEAQAQSVSSPGQGVLSKIKPSVFKFAKANSTQGEAAAAAAAAAVKAKQAEITKSGSAMSPGFGAQSTGGGFGAFGAPPAGGGFGAPAANTGAAFGAFSANTGGAFAGAQKQMIMQSGSQFGGCFPGGAGEMGGAGAMGDEWYKCTGCESPIKASWPRCPTCRSENKGSGEPVIVDTFVQHDPDAAAADDQLQKAQNLKEAIIKKIQKVKTFFGPPSAANASGVFLDAAGQRIRSRMDKDYVKDYIGTYPLIRGEEPAQAKEKESQRSLPGEAAAFLPTGNETQSAKSELVFQSWQQQQQQYTQWLLQQQQAGLGPDAQLNSTLVYSSAIPPLSSSQARRMSRSLPSGFAPHHLGPPPRRPQPQLQPQRPAAANGQYMGSYVTPPAAAAPHYPGQWK